MRSARARSGGSSHSLEAALSETREELRRTQEELRVVLEGVDDGVTAQSADGRLVFANRNAARITGYESAEQLLQAPASEIVQQFEIFDREGRLLTFDELPGRRVLDGGHASEMEVSFRIRATGEERWSVVHSIPIHDSAGSVARVINIFRDITDQRRVDELRVRLAAIVDSSSDAIIGKDLDTKITSWNAGAEMLYGYTASEVVGKTISILVPDDKPDDLPMIMARIKRGERISAFETARIRKDGKRLDVSLSISPIRDATGRVVGAATIARDITKMKLIDLERVSILAREQEARLRAEATQGRMAFLAEASQILASSLEYETTLGNVARLAVPYVGDWCAIEIVEEDGSIRRVALTHPDPERVDFAREMEERYPPGEQTRAAPSVLETGVSQLWPLISDDMLAASAQNEEHLDLLRKFGFISAMVVPLIARERILGSVTFLAAESGRHFGDEDLGLAEDLGRRAALAVDNARLYDQAQRALALREDFLSIASHELKTPLTALQLQIDLLQRSTPSSGDSGSERIQRGMLNARRQIQRLSRLIDDLLDVSRITAGHLELERRDEDLTELVCEVVERFEQDATSTVSRITVHSQGAIRASIDRFKMDQVLTNLISNAVKYGRGQPIDIELQQTEDIVRLQVCDHGIGISREHLSRVFDRFERVTLSQSYGGLGLGLYITKQIVDAHGGTIKVESDPVHGTKFTVEIPR